jgi:hypothetical protein
MSPGCRLPFHYFFWSVNSPPNAELEKVVEECAVTQDLGPFRLPLGHFSGMAYKASRWPANSQIRSSGA